MQISTYLRDNNRVLWFDKNTLIIIWWHVIRVMKRTLHVLKVLYMNNLGSDWGVECKSDSFKMLAFLFTLKESKATVRSKLVSADCVKNFLPHFIVIFVNFVVRPIINSF